MKVVIIGGSHAGIACAKRCREEHPDAEVVIIERKKGVSFVSQTIPLFLIGEDNILEEGHYTTPEELEADGIKALTKREVKTIETAQKRITYANLYTDKLDEMFYDKLVMAAGSYPVLPLVNGIFNETFFLLKNVEDAVAIKNFMERSRDVVIVGAGIVGVELARIFAKKGLHVTVLQARDHVMNRYLDVELATVVENSIRKGGVDLYLNARVVDYHTKKANVFHKSEVIVETDIGKKIKTSGVLLSVGFRPNSYLLRGQVNLGDKGAILVDEYMQTSVSDVFAVGDCATSYFNLLNANRYNPHASEAIRQGVIAAINLFEPKQKLFYSLGTYSLNMQGYTIAVTGLTKMQALAGGYDADGVYFKNEHLDIKEFSCMQLVYEKKTHIVLGFQVVGNVSINEYANVFSLAIQQKLTVEEIEFADFYFEHGYKDPSGFTKIMARLIREKEKLNKR
jgi:NADPH-dependent 2,4-dienoyl-CoA reductase/sulfur reductase-like enzyme